MTKHVEHHPLYGEIPLIERRSLGFNGQEFYVVPVRWQISINWPEGYLTFESPGFVQELVGGQMVTERQCLSPAERERLLSQEF